MPLLTSPPALSAHTCVQLWYSAGMSKADSFTSVRLLESGRFQARHRPRNGAHASKTFDTEEEARAWLQQLKIKLATEQQPPQQERTP